MGEEGQPHIARLCLATLGSCRHRRHVLPAGKDDQRSSSLYVGPDFVLDNLKLHDGLMGTT